MDPHRKSVVYDKDAPKLADGFLWKCNQKAMKQFLEELENNGGVCEEEDDGACAAHAVLWKFRDFVYRRTGRYPHEDDEDAWEPCILKMGYEPAAEAFLAGKPAPQYEQTKKIGNSQSSLLSWCRRRCMLHSNGTFSYLSEKNDGNVMSDCYHLGSDFELQVLPTVKVHELPEGAQHDLIEDMKLYDMAFCHVSAGEEPDYHIPTHLFPISIEFKTPANAKAKKFVLGASSEEARDQWAKTVKFFAD